MTVCERCKQGWQHGGGAKIPVDEAAVEQALCDAQHIGSIDGDAPERAHQPIPPALRRVIWHRDGGRCQTPGCRSTRNLEIHHIKAIADGGQHIASNTTLRCDGCHRAHHDGRLTISGTAPDKLETRWRHEAPPRKPKPSELDEANVGVAAPKPPSKRDHANVGVAAPKSPSKLDDAIVRVVAPKPPSKLDDANVRAEAPKPLSKLDDAIVGVEPRKPSSRFDEAIVRGEAPELDKAIVRVESPRQSSRLDEAIVGVEPRKPSSRFDEAIVRGEAPELDRANVHVESPRPSSKLDEAIVRVEARSALVGMGWKPAIARSALEAAASHVGRDAPVEAWVREALRHCPLPRS